MTSINKNVHMIVKNNYCQEYKLQALRDRVDNMQAAMISKDTVFGAQHHEHAPS